MIKKHLHFIIFIIIYTVLSFITLTTFPLVHSDETWLAGLTKSYMESGSFIGSESFFDLLPRPVHVIKIFFHLLQAPFILAFGYNIISIRLVSLIAALATLVILYHWFQQLKLHRTHALLAILLVACNSQFIYASHFARQEIILLLVFTSTLCIYTCKPDKSYWINAIIIGLSVGFHPNSFIIAGMVGIVYLKDCLHGDMRFIDLLKFVGLTGLIASGFALASFLANASFVKDYYEYGQTLGVDAHFWDRFSNLKDFYLKIFGQISGTYYIPSVRLVLFIGYIVTGLHLVINLVIIPLFESGLSPHFKPLTIHLSKKLDLNLQVIKTCFNLSLGVVAYNVGLFLIGRYNPTSILFLIFIFLLLFTFTLYLMTVCIKPFIPMPVSISFVIISMSLLILWQSFDFYGEYTLMKGHNYKSYQSEIAAYIEDDSIILGNLSSGFVFDHHQFYDIRNLAYLQDESFEDYVFNRDIDTIVYYEEYDYIHRNPEWTILYGEDDYYEDFKRFLNEKATLVHEFENSFYGSRIQRYMGDYPWKIFIYKVKSSL